MWSLLKSNASFLPTSVLCCLSTAFLSTILIAFFFFWLLCLLLASVSIIPSLWELSAVTLSPTCDSLFSKRFKLATIHLKWPLIDNIYVLTCVSLLYSWLTYAFCYGCWTIWNFRTYQQCTSVWLAAGVYEQCEAHILGRCEIWKMYSPVLPRRKATPWLKKQLPVNFPAFEIVQRHHTSLLAVPFVLYDSRLSFSNCFSWQRGSRFFLPIDWWFGREWAQCYARTVSAWF